MSYAQRVKMGAIFVVLSVSLLNAALFTKQNNISRITVGRDIVSQSEHRFEEVKKFLPAQGTVGYVSDVMPNLGPIGTRTEFSEEKYEMEYALTQYALSPLVVDIRSEGHEFVVGNFGEGSDPRAIAADRGLELVRDFGNRIVLFKQAK